jgi:TRAP-type C4-dicarboxylate transport system substrate-binding protein
MQWIELPGSTYFRTAPEYIVEHIREMSNGRMNIEIYAGGELVPNEEVMDAVRDGSIELGEIYGGYFAGKYPIGDLDNFWPFCLETWVEMDALYRIHGLLEYQRSYWEEYGIRYIYPTYYPGPLLTLTEPATSLDDLRNMTIRAIGSKGQILDIAGVPTTYVPYPEIYTALATGVVDGQVSGGIGEIYFDERFHEVSPYLLLPPMQGAAATPMYANLEAWNSLPSDLQRIMDVAMQDYAAYLAATFDYEAVEAKIGIVEEGAEFVTLDDESAAELRAASAEWTAQMAAKDPKLAGFIDIVNDFLSYMGRL